MFPLRDENPTARLTWMTWLLLAVNVAVFAWELRVQAAGGTQALAAFTASFSFDPAALAAAPGSPRVWLTLLTAMFMHAGWVHLGGNMLYLGIFGNNVEDRLGPWGFLGFYLACGLLASLAEAFGTGFPHAEMLGASGAIAGVLGAYLLLYPRARVVTAVFVIFIVELARIPAWIVIGVWFVLQLGAGIAAIGPGAAQTGVAYLAHVGGFLAGMVLIAPAWIVDRSKTRFAGWR
ncbi:MAG TPA: rhomboid family intramembrane serine protease [Coriobacteriia bacterium]